MGEAMKQRMKVLLTSSLLLGVMVGVGSVNGQESFEMAYGNGVHFYFSGDYQKAFDSLSTAVMENQRDPRAYYFRGLAANALGNDGTGDFSQGAQMEAVRGGRLSLVNDALERVQGVTRMAIEDTRTQAMMVARNSRGSAHGVGQTFPVGGEAANTVLVPDTKKEPSPVVTVAPGQEVTPKKEVAVPMPDEAVEVPGSEPTEDLTAKPADDSPFGKVESDESVEAAKEPAPATEDSPFGKVDSTEEPATNEPATEDASPFGEVEEAPGDSATDKPAADESSPFGEVVDGPKTEEPLPKTDDPVTDDSATDDPFGN